MAGIDVAGHKGSETDITLAQMDRIYSSAVLASGGTGRINIVPTQGTKKIHAR